MEALFYFAVPERLARLVLERIIPVAGGATVLPAWGYWDNGAAVESEPIALVMVGVDSRRESWLVTAVLNVLQEAGEQAAWYVKDGVPRLVRFEEATN